MSRELTKRQRHFHGEALELNIARLDGRVDALRTLGEAPDVKERLQAAILQREQLCHERLELRRRSARYDALALRLHQLRRQIRWTATQEELPSLMRQRDDLNTQLAELARLGCDYATVNDLIKEEEDAADD